MPFGNLFAGSVISGTGMSAERYRMEVIANNIANAHATRSAAGGPFRRQEVVFAEVLGAAGLGGVAVTDRVDDPSEFRVEHLPGHPDADEKGDVRFPNVNLPFEMVNLMTATRAYEANVRAAQTYRSMNEQALILLRG